MTPLSALVYAWAEPSKHTAQPVKRGKQQRRVLGQCNHAARYTTVARGRHELEGDKHH